MWRPVLSEHVAAMRIQNMWRNFTGRKGLRQLVRQVRAPACMSMRKAVPYELQRKRKLLSGTYIRSSGHIVSRFEGDFFADLDDVCLARKCSLTPGGFENSTTVFILLISPFLCGPPCLRCCSPDVSLFALSIGITCWASSEFRLFGKIRCMPWNTIPSPVRSATATFRPEKSPRTSP